MHANENTRKVRWQDWTRHRDSRIGVVCGTSAELPGPDAYMLLLTGRANARCNRSVSKVKGSVVGAVTQLSSMGSDEPVSVTRVPRLERRYITTGLAA